MLTSTTGGADAPSFGWIGRAAIAARARQPHMNVFGGEDRFWLGPEGGQFALYFKKGDPFDLDHWQVPEGFDWGALGDRGQSAASARFRKRLSLRNYSDAPFEIDVDRTVRLLDDAEVATHLGVTPAAGLKAVAYESSNTVANAGSAAWQPDTGLVSVWILGHVHSLTGHDHRHSIRRRSGGGTRPGGQRRVFWQGPAGSSPRSRRR